MKLVKCRKCDTTVMTDDTLLESLIGQMNECNRMARKCKPSDKMSYLQQASQISKMVTQVQHRVTQMEERKGALSSNLKILKRYVIENNLMNYEQLDDIEKSAKIEAEKMNKKDEEAIIKIYGSRPNTTTNRTKRDNTAKTAIRNAGR